jgi:hypothetical protein
MNQKFTEGQEVQSKFKNFTATPRFSGVVVEVIHHVYDDTIDYWVEAPGGRVRHFDQGDLELTEWQVTLDKIEEEADLDAVRDMLEAA